THLSPNRLYVNQGDGTFKEQAKQFGFDYTGPSVLMTFADYDLDGDLDGYLVTNRKPTPKNKNQDITIDIIKGEAYVQEEFREWLNVLLPKRGVNFREPKIVNGGSFDLFYRNNGDGTFSEVSKEVGIDGNFISLAAIWWDYNDDGLPDLYVSNDYHGPDRLYHNLGNGRFSEVIKEMIPHTPWFSMGVGCADINNDGRIDFMATDMSGDGHYKQKMGMGDMDIEGWFLVYPEPRQYMRNAVYLNAGTGRFQEIAFMTGLDSTEWTWSPIFGDFDNDGWVDLFVSNGMTRDFFNSDMKQYLRTVKTRAERDMHINRTGVKRDVNVAYRNLGDLRFESVGAEWGLDLAAVSLGAAATDLNGDGHLDLVVNNHEEAPAIYRNHADNHRIKIRLKAAGGRRDVQGVKIDLQTAAGRQVR
ncbi:MAG: VCBS repeat-containing protein, partial [Verrucomicrobiota bacterium]